MASKVFLFCAIFATVALLAFSVDAEDMDDENMEDILCTQDESTRESVLKCISLMPSVHLEIIKECDTRMMNVPDDAYEKLLDIYCSEEEDEEEGFEGVDECITEAYKTRGIDEDDHVKPVIECMQELVTT